jgi:hypothetical protein
VHSPHPNDDAVPVLSLERVFAKMNTPNELCETASGGRLELIHVARIQAAAKLDVVERNARKK